MDELVFATWLDDVASASVDVKVEYEVNVVGVPFSSEMMGRAVTIVVTPVPAIGAADDALTIAAVESPLAVAGAGMLVGNPVGRVSAVFPI